MRSLEKQCPYCGNNFTFVLKYPSSIERQYCSRSCAQKATLYKRSDAQVWSNEEIDYLRSLIGKKQLVQIKATWNDIAKRKGWSERSHIALEVIFTRLCRKVGTSRRTTADNWSNKDLARLLDIPVDRIEVWIEKGLTLAVKAKNAHFKNAIARRDLKKFALSNPDLFWGIDKTKLSKALGDSKLAKYIHETVRQPTVGRPMTIVRLDTGEVYRSAKNAATVLNLGAAGKTAILNQLKRDTPMRNGMEFARIDYPLYWVPLVARAEFNMLAGKIFYEIYLQLRSLDGYSKTSCQIVAERMAVQITLFVFRRNIKEELKGESLTPKQAMIDFWQSYILNNLHKFTTLTKQQMWQKIVGVIKGNAYKTFFILLPNATSKQLQLYLEEYAYYFIEKQTKTYFKREYLPTGYRPTSVLETADLFHYIYQSVYARVEIKENCFEPLVKLNAWQYIKKEIYSKARSADLSGTGMVTCERDSKFQFAANTRAISSHGESGNFLGGCSPQKDFQESSATRQLDDLLAYIESLPTVSQSQAQVFRLYVDLKLEEASDRTIAKTLSITEEEVREVALKLSDFGKEFQRHINPPQKPIFPSPQY